MGGSRAGVVDLTPLGTVLAGEEAFRKLGTPGQRLNGAVELGLSLVPYAAGRVVSRQLRRSGRYLDVKPRERLHGHHADPRHMGGRTDQELYELYESWHREFHRRMARAFKEAGGFPPVGGRGGSAADWKCFLDKNPDKEREAVRILRRETRRFDREYPTSMSSYLDKELKTRGKLPRWFWE